MEIDFFNYISSRVFFQLGNNELLHSIAFFSMNLYPAKYNNKIYNEVLLTIIICFEQRKPKVERIEMLINVITDYKSLKYFIAKKKLIKRQACWVEIFSGFNFVIFYIPGKKN